MRWMESGELMRRSYRLLVMLLVGGLFDGIALAGLKPGDSAPPLYVSNWVKLNPFSNWKPGKPLDLAKAAKGKVVLLEFWATWCPPCIQLIPHTDELYNEHKDDGLLVVGITDSAKGQRLSAVKRFVERRGDGMNYPVAYDSSERSSFAYIYDAGGFGLPHAVVIGKDGRIVWMGHPGMPEMETIIKDLLMNRYDPAVYKAKAEREARIQPLLMEFNQALSRSDWEKCISVANAILEIDPAHFDAMRFAVAILIEEIESPQRLSTWVDQFIEEYPDRVEALSNLAELLINVPDLTKRQPQLAVRAAEAAYKADPSETQAIEAVAYVAYYTGRLDKAIDFQKKAVESADALEAKRARNVLKFYQTCRNLEFTVPGE